MDTDDSKNIEDEATNETEVKEQDDSHSEVAAKYQSPNISPEDQQKIPMYFTLCSERRSRFHLIVENQGKFKFKLSKKVKLQYTLNGQSTFFIETTMTHCKAFKKEPMVWYLETLMPGHPE